MVVSTILLLLLYLRIILCPINILNMHANAIYNAKVSKYLGLLCSEVPCVMHC